MRPRVLIADTDDAWLDVCERGLCESGFMVETARDGLSCLTRLQRNPRPDVIVLELDIPWGGGDGVLARLREETSVLDCGVVIVTGRAPPDVLSERTGIPSSACLRKPFHLDALLNLIGSPGMALAASQRKTCMNQTGAQRTRLSFQPLTESGVSNDESRITVIPFPHPDRPPAGYDRSQREGGYPTVRSRNQPGSLPNRSAQRRVAHPRYRIDKRHVRQWTSGGGGELDSRRPRFNGADAFRGVV
jgi:CheY-like chemotaxis protein